MNIIGIDTSSDFLLITSSYFDKKYTLFKDKQELIGSASALLGIEFYNFLNKNNIDLKKINLLANSNGPGYFTGLKISLSFIKALSLSLKISYVNVASLDIYSHHMLNFDNIFSLTKSVLGNYFFAHYSKSNLISNYLDFNISEIKNYINSNGLIEKNIVFCGNYEDSLKEFFTQATFDSNKSLWPLNFLSLSKVKFKNEGEENIFSTPIYIRKAF